MAGNRIHKIGTIYTRTTGLLKTGAMKPLDKPIWYDVYEAFPPKYEPAFDRKVEETKMKQILYQEDILRAQFYKKYGSPGTVKINEDSKRATICQVFIEEYEQLQSEGNTPTENLMDETALSLESRSIFLDRSRIPTKMASPSHNATQKKSHEFDEVVA